MTVCTVLIIHVHYKYLIIIKQNASNVIFFSASKEDKLVRHRRFIDDLVNGKEHIRRANEKIAHYERLKALDAAYNCQKVSEI